MAVPQSRYPREYEYAKKAISDGHLEHGLALCEILLADTDLPRYYRLNILILLASIAKDWHKKEEFRVHAEHIWNESRALFPQGQDTITDTTLNQLRALLDSLGTGQAKTVPRNYEDTLSAALAETEIEDLADVAEGEEEAMADQEYENPTKNSYGSFQQSRNDCRSPEKSISNPTFAPASTLEASQQILCRPSFRDGQSAGSRMIHRKGGITRRSA